MRLGSGDCRYELDEGWGMLPDGCGKARVHKFDSSGALLLSWGEPGPNSPGAFELPRGVGLDADGRVLVWDGENHRIQVFDQDGEFLAMWTGFRQPTDIEIGPDGEVYIPEITHRFSIADGDGKVLACREGEGSHDPGQFVGPHGIPVDSRGDIHAGEVLEGKRIQRFIRVR